MKYEPTVGEIPTRLFAKAPTPAELGDLISRWPRAQIAEFISALGDGIKFRSAVGSQPGRAIGAALAQYEEEFLDSSGSTLINDLSLGWHGREALSW